MIVPKDNLLRKINDLIDFTFIYNELVSKFCITNGRTAESRIRIFKYLLSDIPTHSTPGIPLQSLPPKGDVLQLFKDKFEIQTYLAMANKPLNMQKIRQILLFLMRGYSEREIVKQTGISRPAVHLYAAIFRDSGQDHDTLLGLKDSELKALLSKLKPVSNEPEDPRKVHFVLQVPYFIE